MWPLQMGRLPSSNVQNVIFITRAKSSLMDVIKDIVIKLTCLLLIMSLLFVIQPIYRVPLSNDEASIDGAEQL